ncbi:MAG: hypothetical protein JW804_07170 [Sedimentisphaerales bacterium]|nr:hypothetical protein [Sedimentisphaerales bacterium]
MQNQEYLGIHLSRHSATVICLQSAHDTHNPAAFFSVSLEQRQIEDGAGFIELINQIAQICTQKQLQFSTVAVALDCSLYMQHEIQSSFADVKQITTTVRFDAEEALATDISDIAIAYRIKSSDESGSKLSIFTAEKKTLTELIKALASNNLDPAVIEPDVNCVYAYINKNQKFDKETLVAAMSKSNVYLLGLLGPGHKEPLIHRTFLIGDEPDRSKLIMQHLTLTLAQSGAEKFSQISFYDSAGFVQNQRLAEKFAADIQPLDLKPPQDCVDAVSFASAAGAVLAAVDQKSSLNFRNDYMPYLGRKRRLENTLKIISVSACIILLALGLNFHLTMMKKNRPVRLLHKKFAEDYQGVMLDKKMPSKSSEAVRKLQNELRRIQNLKKGLDVGGGESVTAKLTSLLAAFNKVAKDTNLNIEKITITDKNISVMGDTANQSSTLKFLTEIKKIMNVESERLGTDRNRSTFTITIGPKR